jgi:hypothetical protein
MTWLSIAGLVLTAGLYLYFTNSGRLRRQLLAAFDEWPVEAVSLDGISFTPWHGLEVRGLYLALRGPGSLADDAPCVRAVLRIERTRIRCRLGALLKGEFVPRWAALDRADVAVVLPETGGATDPLGDTAGLEIEDLANSSAGRGILQMLRRGRPIPELRLGDTNIRVSQSDPRGAQLVRHWRVVGQGAWSDGAYALEMRRTGDKGEPLFTLRWDPQSETCESTCDWLELDTLAVFFPRIAEAWSDLGLRGRGRVRRIALRTDLGAESSSGAESPGGLPLPLTAVDLQFAGLRCSIPVEVPEAGRPPVPAWSRFLQVSNAELTLNCTPESNGRGLVKLTGTGLVNRAPAAFKLTADLAALLEPAAAQDHVVSAELNVTGMHFPTRPGDAAFIDSPRLPLSVRNVLNDFRPSGLFSLLVQARRVWDAETGGGRLHVEGWLDAQGVRCRYHTFPYEFTEARGRTTFSPRGLDLDLTARHGPAHATATGHVNRAAHATGFDLTISGTNVPLDGDLAAALPSKYRRLWDQTDPTGSCDVTVRLQREDGPPELPENPPTETFISADLGDGSSILLEPGKRLEQATGHFEIAEGFIEIQDLRGYLEGSPAMIAGTVGVDSGEADVRIAVSDVPVKRSISVEERADDTPAQINFDGQADVAGRIHTAGEPGTRSDAYVVHLRRGMLTGFDPELQWGDCHGRLIISDRESVIGSFEARQGAARLTAAGTLPGSKGGPVTLDVNIAQAKMETLARQLVPPRWRAQVEALGLAGLGDVQLQLRPESEPEGSARQIAEIQLSAERMEPSALPLDMSDIQAQARLTSDGVEIVEAQARCGEAGQLEVSGELSDSESGWTARFSAAARDVDLSPSVTEALPAELARIVRRLEAQGRLQLEITAGARLAERDGVAWNFGGQLVLSDGALQLGVPLDDIEGGLSGTCRIDPAGGVGLDGALRIESGTLAGRRLAGLAGEIHYRAGERWIRLDELRGQICGGDAVGFVHVDPVTSEYELSVTLQNVLLDEFLPKQPAQDPAALAGQRRSARAGAMRRGVLDGYVFLRGHADDPASRQGGGELRVTGASILQTPVAAEVVEANPHAEAVSDALQGAELRFTWDGAELHFTRLELLSPDLHLAGEGIWNMDSDQIAMTLVGAHPRNWPRMAALGDLLETTERQLVQYHVTGTLAAPQVRAEPLYRLTEALRALILSGD